MLTFRLFSAAHADRRHPGSRLRQVLADVRYPRTVTVVEHNLHVVECADWVINLGPEGGEAGGHIITEGAPETIATCPESITGQILKNYSDQETERRPAVWIAL